MGSPERKKRKHKKSRHSSSSVSQSSQESYQHHSHRKHRKSKSRKYSGSRERSPKKYRQREDDLKKPSPQALWAPGDQSLYPQMQMQMPGMMQPMGNIPGMGAMGFPPFFQQRIPLQMPIPSNYKPNKTVRTIKNPKTQFKGRVYIPYTFDIAMVTLQDPYIQKQVPKHVLNQLTTKVLSTMEKRAREQKQDDLVLKKISNLQEEMTQFIKQLPIKRKKGEIPDHKQKLTQIASLALIAQSPSLEQALQGHEEQIDQEIMDMITKLGLKPVKDMEIERELEPSQLIKEAKELQKAIKI